VVRILKNYVLIDIEKGLGDKGDLLEVYRVVADKPVAIGSVRIVRSRNGKTAAEIVQVAERRQIQIGDRVALSDKRLNAMIERDVADSIVPAVSPVFKMNPSVEVQRARIDLGIAAWVPGSEFDVRQPSAVALTLRGTLLHWKKQALAAEITVPVFSAHSHATTKHSQFDLDFLLRLGMGQRLSYELGSGMSLVQAAGDVSASLKVAFRFGAALDFNTPWAWPASVCTSLKTFKAKNGWGTYMMCGIRVGLPFFKPLNL